MDFSFAMLVTRLEEPYIVTPIMEYISAVSMLLLAFKLPFIYSLQMDKSTDSLINGALNNLPNVVLLRRVNAYLFILMVYVKPYRA